MWASRNIRFCVVKAQTVPTSSQVGTSTVTSFNNTGLAAATTYRYRVRAVDAAGNVSTNSNSVSATTQAVSDTTPPTAPTGLAATVASSSQINLSGPRRPTTWV